MKILSKYVLKIFFSYLGISLLLFSFILIMEQVFQLVEIVVVKGAPVTEIFILLFYSFPTILVFSAPMAATAASVITFGTLASDREITAIRTSGTTISTVVKPVITAALLITALMLPFNFFVTPASQFAFRRHSTKLAHKQPAIQMEEGTQVEVGDYTLLAHKINHREQTMQEVLINKPADEDEPEMFITARSGAWNIMDNTLSFVLYDGIIRHQPKDRPEILSSAAFNEYTIVIIHGEEDFEVTKNLQSMSPAEMKEEIKRLKEKNLPVYNVKTHFHLRGALAGAIAALVLCGIPLGLKAEAKGKTVGAGISLAIIGAYYFLLVSGIKLAFSGDIIPWLGIWLPNFIIACFGIIMLKISFNK